MERIKAVFNWSGGKDSAHALLRAMQSGKYEIVALLTTVNRDTHRSTMHGIPTALLQAQADSIGIPLHIVDLTPKGNMEDYGAAMSRAVEYFKAQGVTCFIFGDIFLHDVRKYRERQLAPHGIGVAEPLWGKSSGDVMHDRLAACGRRSQRRERRIPHILLRRADLPHPRPVPARHAFAPKLPHPP